MKDYKIGQRAARALLVLISQPEASTAAIATAIGSSPRNARAGLAELVRGGWIEPTGERAAPWRLTGEAEDALLGSRLVDPDRYSRVPQIAEPRSSANGEIGTLEFRKTSRSEPQGTDFPREGGVRGGSSLRVLSSEVRQEKEATTTDRAKPDPKGKTIDPRIDEEFDRFWAIEGVFRKRPHRTQSLQIFTRIAIGKDATTAAAVAELKLEPHEVAALIVRGTEAALPEYQARPPDKRPHASTWLRQAIWADSLELEPPLGAEWDLCRRIVQQRETKPRAEWTFGETYGDLDAAGVKRRHWEREVIRAMSARWSEWVRACMGG